ncbi:uncharacterized protein BCR38DRAFT_484639 [Pseudomassariella vexata]|uniref:Apple domain-containing protein n=1 Tax=Pseudomassariella vexata TaxID=1141098 RepID=A0A1Y2E0V4_9PEZI|nr:uncharacterized protein BCR38DRAFT_484639 [Pseudomassariella vexata]ORY65181.1 hypothetical protein BCR38DRAFT_484639 [Pseudomassariella vexata]
MVQHDVFLRQNFKNFPCPSGNGTQMGAPQSFDILCGTNINGVEIGRMFLDSLNTCMSSCTSQQNPRCEAVTFQLGNTCILKGSINRASSAQTLGMDSAIGIPANPPPTSNCVHGAIQLVQAKNFNMQCRQVVFGNDLEQQFHTRFADCMTACASNSACRGVSFDVNQSAGFKNCYLKTGFGAGELFQKEGVDSAFLMANNGAAVFVPGSSSISETSLVTLSHLLSPSSTVEADAQPESAGVGMTTFVSVSAPQETASAGLSLALVSPSALPTPASQESSSMTSNVWVAAPVIGSLAAVVLILSIFILWGRRRRNSHEDGSGKNPLRGRAFFGGAKLADEETTTRAIISGSGSTRSAASRGNGGGAGVRVLSGSGRRVGYEAQSAGTGPGLDGIKGVRGLRDGLNGLRQNSVDEPLPGIPVEFRGPRAKR